MSTIPAQESFPITELTPRLATGEPWQFTCVTEPGWQASVVAFDDKIPVGALRWLIELDDDDSGLINMVYVHDGWRRQGIASGLLTVAEAYADAYGWPRPRHDDGRTPDGDAWATAVGAQPAVEISDALTRGGVSNPASNGGSVRPVT